MRRVTIEWRRAQNQVTQVRPAVIDFERQLASSNTGVTLELDCGEWAKRCGSVCLRWKDLIIERIAFILCLARALDERDRSRNRSRPRVVWVGKTVTD